MPFRSSFTGLPAPRIGGAVVKAHPILFWNVLFPDPAADRWAIVRERAQRDGALDIRRFRKADTGDCRLSRASVPAHFRERVARLNPGGGYRALFTGADRPAGLRLDLTTPGQIIVTEAH